MLSHFFLTEGLKQWSNSRKSNVRHNEIKLLDFKGKTGKIKQIISLDSLGPPFSLPRVQCVSALLINGNSSKMGVPADHKDHFFFFLLTLVTSEKKSILSQLCRGHGDFLLSLYLLTMLLGELYVKYLYVILMYNPLSLKCIWLCLRLLTDITERRGFRESLLWVIIFSLAQIKFSLFFLTWLFFELLLTATKMKTRKKISLFVFVSFFFRQCMNTLRKSRSIYLLEMQV